MSSPSIQRALISVSDKLGLGQFAQGLAAAGVEIFSTGGTRKYLQEQGLAVRDVAEYTGFPEMLEGRVKTLHPKVHGGILARRDRPDDLESLARHGIVLFDLVVVNLYPFAATVARSDVTIEEAIEQIDIGGPSLIRAAAKNHQFVTVATNAEQYSAILDEINRARGTSLSLRRQLAQTAFAHTASYDQAIAAYLTRQAESELLPPQLDVQLRRKAILRYGENPHQQAALYADPGARGANLVSAQQLAGKELSYNNLLDLDSALALARALPDSAVVVIKHNNPCGAASAAQLFVAARRALEGDPLSAFGSVLGFNRTLDAETAEALCEPGLFIEAIVAPDYETRAVEILTTQPKWKANVRLLKVGAIEGPPALWHLRQIEGGMLLQEADTQEDPESAWRVATQAQPTDEQMADLRFAWAVVRHVKSNAIVVARDRMVLGVGAGQMSRVDSVELALKKAGPRAAGALLASDAFFPFADSIEQAAQAGIRAVIQPGGSRRDDEVLQAANRHSLPMVITGRRHFKH